MTRTVFDHIMEYSFEDDKKIPQGVLHIQHYFLQSGFRHEEDMSQPLKFLL